jgi:hypothetical protein
VSYQYFTAKKGRNIEQVFAPGHRNIHFLWEEMEQYQQTEYPFKQEASVEFKKVIEAEGDIKKVALDPRVPDRAVCLGTKMSPQELVELLEFLDKNSDAFAWSASDLVGVSKEIIEHKLQVNLNMKPKKQKHHKMSEKKVEAVQAEVQRRLDAGFMREVTYPQWLANLVMVQKKNIKW